MTMYRSELNNTDNLPAQSSVISIIMDTGCSFSCTFDERDFVGPIIRGHFGNAQGISGTSPLTARGIVRYKVFDPDGAIFDLTCPAFLMPASSQRLLSPQQYAQFHSLLSPDPLSDTFGSLYGGTRSEFWFLHENKTNLIRIPIHPTANLPILLGHEASTSSSPTTCACQSCSSCCHTAKTPVLPSSHLHSYSTSVLDSPNLNLTSSQKQLLLDHQRLGHVSFPHLQELYRETTVECDFDGCSTGPSTPSDSACLPNRSSSLSSCDPPLCLACQASKARRRPSGTKHSKPVPTTAGSLSFDVSRPGELVSVDHYESAIRGRLLSTRGRENETNKHCGGTIFYDHYSSFVSVHHQPTLGATETLKSKRAFEIQALGCGNTVDKFRTDNGIFTSKLWTDSLLSANQSQSLSGVGAHHQNGVAERAIQTVTLMARSMLLHMAIHWPDQFSEDLWPMALAYAAFLHNHIPKRSQGLAPIELFCGTRLNCSYLRRARVFGCPSFVLDPKLQDGKKLPKWKPRSRQGQFLGFSPDHSTSVSLILNVQTGSISPQFHVVFDEKFTTVSSSHSITDRHESILDLLRQPGSRENLLDDIWDPLNDGPAPELADEWLSADEISEKESRVRRHLRDLRNQHRPDTPPSPLSNFDKPDSSDLDTTDNTPLSGEPEPDDFDLDASFPDDVLEPVEPTLLDSGEPLPASIPALVPSPSSTPSVDLIGSSPPPLLRRSSRRRTPPNRLHNPIDSRTMDFRRKHVLFADTPSLSFPTNLTLQTIHQVNWNDDVYSDPCIQPFQHLLNVTVDPFTMETYVLHPLLFKSQIDALDNPRYREVASLDHEDPESQLWKEAMNKELQQLHDKGTYEIVAKATIEGKIIPTTWVFKRKRLPDGTIYKYKARLCIRGDLQAPQLDRNDTYAPVASWDTIRLMFSLCVQHGIKSRQIDFANAFVQAERDEPIYLALPPGFSNTSSTHCMKVTKSLYGDARAPRMWYDHLTTALSSMGFTPSPIDPCLFLRKDCIFLFWVDDAIICSHDDSVISSVIQDLRQRNFDIDDDTGVGSMENYLGIQLAADPSVPGSLHLTQPHLISRIVDSLGLTDAKPVSTPAVTILHKDNDSDPHDQWRFNYRSVIGMLNYLANNTRPDISFAVHQCARFSHAPQQVHAEAVKRIGRYLIGTSKNGLIVRPTTTTCRLDCYADADFAGLWNAQQPNVVGNLRSRTGYLLTLGNTPVVWASKLQGVIALSTMESEFISLSAALKALIPLRDTHQRIATALSLPYESESRIFEDNQACITLATTDPPRMTPRSKHIAIRYFWFREHLRNCTQLKIVYIPTNDQRANHLTKPLPTATFLKERRTVLGW
jgi:hypothetical protein